MSTTTLLCYNGNENNQNHTNLPAITLEIESEPITKSDETLPKTEINSNLSTKIISEISKEQTLEDDLDLDEIQTEQQSVIQTNKLDIVRFFFLF